MALGSAADWVSALATVGALVAAIAAGRIARNLYRIESNRDDERRRQNVRRDAGRVHAWTASWFDPDEHRSDGLVIANTSESPVFDMRIESIDFRGAPQPPLTLSVVPPGQYFVERTDTRYLWDFPNLLAQMDGAVRPIMKTSEWRVSRMTFVDVHQREWTRVEGKLLDPA